MKAEGKDKGKAFKPIVTVLKTKSQYVIHQPKLDLQKLNGCISFFHMVSAVEDEEDATLSLSETKVQSWLSIPLLSNKQQLPAGSALTFYNPPLDEAKPAKKRKV